MGVEALGVGHREPGPRQSARQHAHRVPVRHKPQIALDGEREQHCVAGMRRQWAAVVWCLCQCPQVVSLGCRSREALPIDPRTGLGGGKSPHPARNLRAVAAPGLRASKALRRQQFSGLISQEVVDLAIGIKP